MKIHIDPNSLNRTDFGLVTGIIFFQESDYYFPDLNWNDSILFVLDSLLINITQQNESFEVLYMEVPCEVHINIDYVTNSICFACLERDKDIEHESNIKFSDFVKNLSQEINKMLRESPVLTKSDHAKYSDYMSKLSNIKKMYE